MWQKAFITAQTPTPPKRATKRKLLTTLNEDGDDQVTLSVLRMIVVRDMFDVMVDGEKKVEYKPDTPTWRSRLFHEGDLAAPKRFDVVRVYNARCYDRNARWFEAPFLGVSLVSFDTHGGVAGPYSNGKSFELGKGDLWCINFGGVTHRHLQGTSGGSAAKSAKSAAEAAKLMADLDGTIIAQRREIDAMKAQMVELKANHSAPSIDMPTVRRLVESAVQQAGKENTAPSPRLSSLLETRLEAHLEQIKEAVATTKQPPPPQTPESTAEPHFASMLLGAKAALASQAQPPAWPTPSASPAMMAQFAALAAAQHQPQQPRWPFQPCAPPSFSSAAAWPFPF